MTTTQHKIIEEYYEKFNGAYFRSMLDLLDENIVHEINQSGAETGRKAFEMFLNRKNECYQERVHDLVIMAHEDGRNGSAEFAVTGTYRKTDGSYPAARGQVYTIRGGAFFEFRDEKIARVTDYFNLQEWLDKVR